ncbi:MAG: class I adenylate-forming enzyme family protein, partial [Pseudomonadota bacterium]
AVELATGVALERQLLGVPLDGVRLWRERGRPQATSGAAAAAWLLANEALAGKLGGAERVVVLGGDGLVGEVLAAALPGVRVTSLLDPAGPVPPGLAHAHLRIGQRADGHDVAYAAAGEPLPVADGAADLVICAVASLPPVWRAEAARLAGSETAVIVLPAVSAAAVPAPEASAAEERPPEAFGELRVFAVPVSLAALAQGRLTEGPAAGRPLTPVEAELFYFGRRGSSLAALARDGARPLATVVRAARALQREGLLQLLPATAAAARLHHYLVTGEPLPPPGECAPVVVWRRAVARFGARPALILHDGVSLSYADLDRLIAGFVATLGELGLRPGERIGVLADPCVELHGLFWAAMTLGLRYLPVPLGTTAAGVAAVHGRAPIAVLFVDERLGVTGLDGSAAGRIERFTGTTEGGGFELGVRDDEAAIAVSRLPPTPATAAPGIDIPTSGTTGASKIVVLGGEPLVDISFRCCQVQDWADDERFLSAQHPSEITQIRYSQLQIPLVGAANIVGEPSRPGHVYSVWALAERYGATRLRFSPALAGLIVRGLAEGRIDRLATLTSTMTDSTHFPRPLRRDLVAKLAVRSFEAYGATEAMSALGNVLEPGAPPRPVEYGAVIQVRRDDGSVAVDDEIGTIWMLRDDYMEGYLTDQGLDRSVIQGFWFSPGDQARRTATGVVEIAGRRDDLFSTATGQLVVPTAIEDVLQSHSLVEAAVVVPGLDRSGGTQIVAYVEVAAPAAAPAELATTLTRLVRDELGDAFRPAAVHLVDALPRNNRDKLVRRTLAGLPVEGPDGTAAINPRGTRRPSDG